VNLTKNKFEAPVRYTIPDSNSVIGKEKTTSTTSLRATVVVLAVPNNSTTFVLDATGKKLDVIGCKEKRLSISDVMGR